MRRAPRVLVHWLCVTALLGTAPSGFAEEDDGDDAQDLCLSTGGQLPDDPPRVQTDDCGPYVPTVEVIVRIVTPVTSHEQVIGNCHDRCDKTYVLEIRACRAFSTNPKFIEMNGSIPEIPEEQRERAWRMFDPAPPAVQSQIEPLEHLQILDDCTQLIGKRMDLT